jgi:hypothetical protein
MANKIMLGIYKSYLNALSDNPWTILISLAIGIAGIILSVIFFIKSKRKKSITYYVDNNTLFNKLIKEIKETENIDLPFIGSGTKKSVVTNFIFWNNGTETIYRKDIPDNDKFKIIRADSVTVIFKCSIKKVTNKSNNIIAFITHKNEILIDFEYLDIHDGFILQVIHNYNRATKFNVNGNIMGFGKIQKGQVKESLLKKIFINYSNSRIYRITSIILKVFILSYIAALALLGPFYLLYLVNI